MRTSIVRRAARWCMVAVGLAAVVGAPPLAVANGAEFDGDPATTERVSGSTPTEVAAAVSRLRFGDGAAAHVVLSRDDDFPDSLAGAALTAAGPLLFTGSALITDATMAELQRVLRPGGRVYLLGGPDAIGGQVEEDVRGRGFEIVRLAGETRVETSIAVAEEVRRLHPDATTVALARAAGTQVDPTAGWADSVTGGAWAASSQTPVLVTPSDTLHPAVAAALQRFAPERTLLLGGTVALSDQIATQITNGLRVSGAERAATAAAIAEKLWPTTNRYVAINGYSSDGWAYGLAAAGLAADAGAPLLLTQRDDVPRASLQLASSQCGAGPRLDLLVIGDESVVGGLAVSHFDAADGGPCPPDPSTASLPLPPGHEELRRQVGQFISDSPVDVFVVSDGGGVDDAVMSLFVPVADGYALEARAPAHADYLLELRTDALNHVLVTFGVGAHSVIGYAWGFESGPRLHPSPDGLFSNSNVELLDVNGDGVLELRVYSNDCEPNCADGTVTYVTYGWVGDHYDVVEISPPPPAPALTLQANGIGLARFGDPMDATIRAIQDVLGSVDEDIGWEPGHSSSFGYCSYVEVRGVRWGAFYAVFVDDAPGPALSNPRLEAYLHQGDPGSQPDLATEAGVRLGVTETELRAAYPQVQVYPQDGDFWPAYSLELSDSSGSGTMYGFFNPDQEPDRVYSVIANLACGE